MKPAIRVLLTQGAEQDIEAIYDYLAAAAGATKAVEVLEQLMLQANSLSLQADRGHYPAELLSLGIKEYRQVLFATYRLIYRVTQDDVVIYLIADSRRDMQALLMRRLLSA